MTQVITVDFTPPQGTAGSCQFSYSCTKIGPLLYGAAQNYKLVLGDVHGWNFYAISFWGGINESSSAGSAVSSNVAEVFLDGWFNGSCYFPVNGTPTEFVSDVYVNCDSNHDSTTDISFCIHNKAQFGGVVGLEVALTTSTNPQDQTQFFCSRDPEIKLEKEETGA